MNHDEENIILFPKWEVTLKEEGFRALQEKRYTEALDKLNELLRYNTQDHEVIIGKLMCLMELGRYHEAEDMCEGIIQNKQDDHYFHYVHIYLTILFQTNKYDILMELIEEELASDNLPTMLREQFMQLYDMSEKMESDIVEKQLSVYIEELLDAVTLSNHEKQWRAIVKLRSMEVEPERSAIDLLELDNVHPVIKTGIFIWLQEHHHTSMVHVQKLGKEINVMPNDIPEITIHPIYIRTLGYLHELEQENPTLYQFLEQLLYRYFFVQYPILPNEKDAILLAESLQIIGSQIMNQQDLDSNVDRGKTMLYLEDIVNAEQLYLSIIEE